MAEEEKGGDAMADALFFFGLLALLILVWFMSGGPERADLRGMFLAPPPPLDSGEAYGPGERVEAPDTLPPPPPATTTNQ